MHNLKTTHSLKIQGEDAIKFIESLISIDPIDKIYKTSFLLKPDGKIAHWFIILRQGTDMFLFQSEQELINIKKSLEFYKIRTKCTLDIISGEKYLSLKLEETEFKFKETDEKINFIDWSELSIILDLPLPETSAVGLLPNETKWLDFMVDFNKGCFLGQEQASRVKFRGRPRRLLTSSNNIQKFLKI